MNTVKFGKDANYRVTVRTFPSMVEVVTRPVNWQLEQARSNNCGLVAPRKKTKDLDVTREERERKDTENLARSIRRAKQGIRWLIQRMEADHMVTLTYRENMMDIDRLKKDFDQFRRLVVARYPDWKYVVIREQQDRGSLHMHIAVKGRQNIDYLRYCWYKVLGCMGASGADALGSVNVRAPSKRWGGKGYQWRQDKLAGYLSKYLHKGFDLAEHSSKRYWSSKRLPQANIQRFWLGSQNVTEMILDSINIAMLSGMEDWPNFYQSNDQSVLVIRGCKAFNSKIKTLAEVYF